MTIRERILKYIFQGIPDESERLEALKFAETYLPMEDKAESLQDEIIVLRKSEKRLKSLVVAMLDATHYGSVLVREDFEDFYDGEDLVEPDPSSGKIWFSINPEHYDYGVGSE